MMKIATMIAAAMLALSPISAIAATAEIQPAPTCENGGSLATFKEAAKTSATDMVILEDQALTTFETAFDKIIGASHSDDITAIAFINPDTAQSDTIQMAVFKSGCYVGLVPVPKGMIVQALGAGI